MVLQSPQSAATLKRLPQASFSVALPLYTTFIAMPDGVSATSLSYTHSCIKPAHLDTIRTQMHKCVRMQIYSIRQITIQETEIIVTKFKDDNKTNTV